jgi:hypothetical protein
MKVFAIFSALALAFTVSTNRDPCCNYTNGGQCITHCPASGSLSEAIGLLAEKMAIEPVDGLPAGTEAVAKKADGV